MGPNNRIARATVTLLWLGNFGIIVGFWAALSGSQMLAGQLHPAIAFGRLAGLLATFCALMQFVLMGRGAWLEPLYGLDRLARAHRLNGYAAYVLLLLHPILLVIGYSQLSGLAPFEQLLAFLAEPLILLAAIGSLLFTIMIGTTIYIVRKHLKFETWYYVHLLAYAAIALLPWHQLTYGGSLGAHTWFSYYWIALYMLVAVNMLIWRFGVPMYNLLRFGFRVERVEPAGPRATSVYISGRKVGQFKARGGMFVLVRFFAKGMWRQEHPFSLSQLPNNGNVRLTVRQLGDFTNMVPKLRPGTKVMVSGPYGAFTLDRKVQKDDVYIVGGIGITPIRSILEERAAISAKNDAVLLYSNRNQQDIPLKEELDDLATKSTLHIHHILSDEPDYPGEKGFIDREKLERLVPDIQKRDIFLCGPPPMMEGVIKALREIGVPDEQLHYEIFNLHVK